MKKSSIYTKKKMGLDYNVWVVMLIVVIGCTGWIGYKKATDESCSNFSIAIKGINSDNVTSANVGEILRFRASVPSSRRVTWDFADRSPIEEGSSVTHSFKHEGTYTITAKVNGKCETIKTVYIRKQEIVRDNKELETAETLISGNTSPEVQEPVTYICNVSADSYEWSVLNRLEFKTQREKLAVFTFSIPGAYTVQLKLDNDREKVYTKEIQVLPSTKLKNEEYLPTKKLIPNAFPMYPPVTKEAEKPVEKPAEKPEPKVEEKAAPEVKAKKIFFIPNEPFMGYLNEVIEGEKDISFFNQYLNNGGETLVQVNGEKKMIRFSELYQRLKGSKRISIREVTIDRDSNNDVIKININYKKRLF